MNRFGFIDSSGIIKKDRFFGTGLLVVSNVGDMVDKLAKNSQPACSIVKSNKNKTIDKLIADDKKDEAIRILRKTHRFEMKFDNIRPTTNVYYERMIDIFLSDKENRFSAMIVDRENPKFDGNSIADTWEAYTGYSALLAVHEMSNMPTDKLCIVVDEISKPHSKPLSLEDTLLSKIRNETAKVEGIDFENIFGTLSIESHSNMLMQLCDVLLGAVMYDFKKKHGYASDAMNNRKEPLVQKIREVLKVKTLAENFTENSLAYFKVFESI